MSKLSNIINKSFIPEIIPNLENKYEQKTIINIINITKYCTLLLETRIFLILYFGFGPSGPVNININNL